MTIITKQVRYTIVMHQYGLKQSRKYSIAIQIFNDTIAVSAKTTCFACAHNVPAVRSYHYKIIKHCDIRIVEHDDETVYCCCHDDTDFKIKLHNSGILYNDNPVLLSNQILNVNRYYHCQYLLVSWCMTQIKQQNDSSMAIHDLLILFECFLMWYDATPTVAS